MEAGPFHPLLIITSSKWPSQRGTQIRQDCPQWENCRVLGFVLVVLQPALCPIRLRSGQVLHDRGIYTVERHMRHKVNHDPEEILRGLRGYSSGDALILPKSSSCKS
jgi:hypothetical protein